MTEALQGITVLDFTQGMAGSIATMVLSDFGAEVIKIESPRGDPFRAFPPSLVWNRGKKSVVVDLQSSEGRRQLHQLAPQADVVVESFRPGVAERLGIGYEELSAVKPDLVYTSVTGFGPRGSYANYKGYEALVAAKSGRLMVFAGMTGREGPGHAAVNAASHAAAMAVVRGTLSALSVRDATGKGQRVDTSLLQGVTYYDLSQWILWQMMINFPDEYPFDETVIAGRPSPLQYLPARTKDGKWIQLANLVERLFHAQIRAIGLGHIYKEERFADTPRLEDDAREELRRLILAKMQEKTLDEWMEYFVNEQGDVAAEPFMTANEGLSHPQMIYNRIVEQIEDPTVGPMRMLGTMFHMDGTPPSIKGPAPLLGQHTEEVLGMPSPDRNAATNGASNGTASVAKSGSNPERPGPLSGVTVLDLSTVIAGPLSGSLTAELGARVIRIETLQGDMMRGHYNGIATNRTMAGTEGLSLNLKTDEGQAIIKALIPKADVLLHNMRPGAPERVGIGFDQARELNPDIVYVYVGGYGSTGPHSHRPAMHPIGGAVSGGAVAQMGRGTIPPEDAELDMEEIVEVSRRLGRAQDVNPDPNTSMVTSTAIAMGLYARQRFGKPQYVETTMIGSNAFANANAFFDYEGAPERPVAGPDGYGLNALYRIYEADGGWIYLACPMEDEWCDLCRALDRSDLMDDPRFADSRSRETNDDALVAELAPIFASQRPEHWETTLSAADVGCVKVEDRGMFHFFDEDQHVRENGFTTEAEHPRHGKFWRHSTVLNFSETPGKIGGGILRGQHTKPILHELGYTDDQIDELRAKGVLDWEDA
ncbi:MAG: CoA transferase [SAR202 cluster bacterium]|nr:CoA transferase [SAR202 cluster bacterium]